MVSLQSLLNEDLGLRDKQGHSVRGAEVGCFRASSGEPPDSPFSFPVPRSRPFFPIMRLARGADTMWSSDNFRESAGDVGRKGPGNRELTRPRERRLVLGR